VPALAVVPCVCCEFEPNTFLKKLRIDANGPPLFDPVAAEGGDAV